MNLHGTCVQVRNHRHIDGNFVETRSNDKELFSRHTGHVCEFTLTIVGYLGALANATTSSKATISAEHTNLLQHAGGCLFFLGPGSI